MQSLTSSRSQSLALRFMQTFISRASACTFGVLDPTASKGMRYVTWPRPFNERDVKRHFAGEVSIVAIPLLETGTCYWGAKDHDFHDAPFDTELPFHRFLSKSGYSHDLIFFSEAKPAAQVRELLRQSAIRMGTPKIEIFPKQNSAQVGSGINLPFFGDETGFERFHPSFYSGPLPEAIEIVQHEVGGVGDDDEGYWSDEALLAMLTAYKDINPGFEFRQCRNGFAVPCPGHDDSWEDGAAHSVKAERLSHETIVFLKSGWPKFRCVHAHCDGGCGDAPKKTINDWRAYWDPLRLWEFDEWQEKQMEQVTERGRLLNVR